MKYRIYGQYTGNTGDKSESIPWPFISIRASCALSAWRITRTINTKPWWKWCCATRIPSRGSVCSAITSRWRRQSRPWRPAWPAKAWRSSSTRGWNKHPASVPPVKLPCGWKNGGTGIPPVKLDLHNQIRCLSDYTTPFLLNKQNPEHRLKSSLCFGFIGRRQAWRSVDFCCRKGKVLLKLEQGSVWFQYKQEY